jgi:anti-anti-sigma regulatory factor
MIVAVFTPPSRIDGANVVEFATTVRELVARDRCVVLDCSGVVWIAASGMRVLEMASRTAQITLVNPSPAVHLMAATFARDVSCRYDRLSSGSTETLSPRRLVVSVPPGRVAS